MNHSRGPPSMSTKCRQNDEGTNKHQHKLIDCIDIGFCSCLTVTRILWLLGLLGSFLSCGTLGLCKAEGKQHRVVVLRKARNLSRHLRNGRYVLIWQCVQSVRPFKALYFSSSSRPVHSNANSTSLGSNQPRCNY